MTYALPRVLSFLGSQEDYGHGKKDDYHKVRRLVLVMACCKA